MLSINNLYKSFGGIQAINNVSLNIEKSTVTALIGPNGAGKTTLFNIINGSIKPDSGSIKLENIDITSYEPHQLFNLGILRTFQIAHEFASLTVRDNLAGSHQNKGWEIFTDKVIELISNETNNTVFLLWGSFAKQKRKLIDVNKHKILESGHPSPLSANRGYWFGNKHFSRCNEYLDSYGKKKIDWLL